MENKWGWTDEHPFLFYIAVTLVLWIITMVIHSQRDVDPGNGRYDEDDDVPSQSYGYGVYE